MSKNNSFKYKGHTIRRITETAGLNGKEIKPYASFVVRDAKTTGDAEGVVEFAPLYRTTRGGGSIKEAIKGIKRDIDWYQSQGWIN